MKSHTKRTIHRNGQRGLTLFELLVVLAILALLSTLIAPRVIGYLGRAKTEIAKSQTANIAASLELFYLDLGRYPSVDEGLMSLIEPPNGLSAWRGPYMKEASALTDPWGRQYIYTPDDTFDAFTIISYGRDGKEGGEHDDADILKR